MGEIADNITKVKDGLPQGVTLIAVSKTKPEDAIMDAYKGGQRIFGENKIQELVSKHENLPKDIRWQMIGHLQTNKVKYIAEFIDLVHAVDSLKLLTTIDKEAKKHNRVINCLLQVKIAQEETKYGLSQNALIELLKRDELKAFENIGIVGLMGMASYTDDESQIKAEFNSLSTIFNQVKVDFFQNNDYFSELSMGMSGDYLLAIEEGATLVRVGSTIFGTRIYT